MNKDLARRIRELIERAANAPGGSGFVRVSAVGRQKEEPQMTIIQPKMGPAIVRKDGELAMMTEVEQFLSATAWEMYLKHGRGAIWAEERNGKIDIEGSQYCRPDEGADAPELVSDCKSYDPETQFLLIVSYNFVGDEYDYRCWTWNPEVPPPKASAALS